MVSVDAEAFRGLTIVAMRVRNITAPVPDEMAGL